MIEKRASEAHHQKNLSVFASGEMGITKPSTDSDCVSEERLAHEKRGRSPRVNCGPA